MREAVIAGAGMTPFVRRSGMTASALAAESARTAIAESMIPATAIEAIFGGSALSTAAFAQRTLEKLGLRGIRAINVENACSSGSTALELAWQAVRSGQHDAVLVVGADVLSTSVDGPLALDKEDRKAYPGLTFPAWYALKASRMLELGQVEMEDLAMVAVKNRAHAEANPFAQFRTRIGIEDVLRSDPVADPLTLLQCCPKADGAASVVVTSRELWDRYADGALARVSIAASVLVSGRPHGVGSDSTWTAAQAAYDIAGIDPSDVSTAEVHDAFSIGELLHYESLGLCAAGDSVSFLRSGATKLGGRVPVSPSGGLLSRGHPPGATGVAQIVELTWQLRRQVPPVRQVEGARVGLAHTQGASIPTLEANATCVTLLTT